MESYKFKFNLSGKEVYSLFDKYDVFSYLKDGYDMLHTQGEDWLVNDINQIIKLEEK